MPYNPPSSTVDSISSAGERVYGPVLPPGQAGNTGD